ncbi:efflux RND transporter periplasmic adaptor subunit [Moraxella bovoculi]|uniref:efflux RND transporter periplasmic adaptor subunit n=1 Tax=Moraxella bovoculi TaxID=386891 RepID=UPI0009BB88A1|nr:efflux RND transporter periplasmic adaptor subunit [Moraxella bovoculi]
MDDKKSNESLDKRLDGAFDRYTKFPWWLPISALALVALGLVLGLGIGRVSDGDKASNDNVVGASVKSLDSQEANTAPVMSVEAITPSSATIFDAIDASGIIAARHTAQVSGRVTGAPIEQVLVEVGDQVRAGQVLAILDASSFKDSHIQAQADLDQAIASAQKAHADLARTEPLLQIGAISRQQVDTYRTAAKQADATVVAAKAKMNNTATSLNNAKITAPVSGIISERQAQVGVLTSGNPLFTIIKDGALEWQATLAPNNAAKISIGQEATIMAGNTPIVGKVIRLSPTANQGREMTVHVAIPQGAPLSAGMYQTGKFVLSQSSAPAVPTSAIMTTDGYDYVWSLTPTDQAEGLYKVVRTKVDILGYDGDKAATNLPPDALIVAKSAGFLAESDIVRVATVNANAPQSSTHQAVGQ